MSNRYKGAILSATPPTVTASVGGDGGTASGSWSLGQQIGYAALGTWPSFPVYQLWSWGFNNTGQLGLGNKTFYSSPKQVGSLTNWSKGKVECGFRSIIVIKTDGTLWVWGESDHGELGLGNITSYSSPKQVGSLTNWLNNACGNYHTITIKTDGTLWTWGYNGQGSLGLGNITNYSSPKQVGSLTTWLNIAGGRFFTAATKTDGTLWTWGQNNAGQLGLGNVTNYSSPKQVGALTNWLNIAGGYYFTVATKTDGTLWTWGKNEYGQLGLGNSGVYNPRSSPNQVGSLTTWSKIECGYAMVIATKTDGTLWTWGWNTNGQLGLGNITNYSSPKQVGSLTNWINISESKDTGGTSRATKTDGTLWTWGYNNRGQLGLGNITDYSSPKQVGSLTTWSAIGGTGEYFTIAIKTP